MNFHSINYTSPINIQMNFDVIKVSLKYIDVIN